MFSMCPADAEVATINGPAMFPICFYEGMRILARIMLSSTCTTQHGCRRFDAQSAVWTALHRIDATSPLHGLSPAELSRLQAQVVVAFSGVDETIERSVHAQAHWPAEQLRFGYCFADILEDQPSGAGTGPPRRINWAAFDRICPCPLQ